MSRATVLFALESIPVSAVECLRLRARVRFQERMTLCPGLAMLRVQFALQRSAFGSL